MVKGKLTDQRFHIDDSHFNVVGLACEELGGGTTQASKIQNRVFKLGKKPSKTWSA